MRTVIRQNGVDLVWNSVSEAAKELRCDPACRPAVKLNKRELRRPIDGNEETEPALGSLHFGDIDMEEADRIGLELLLGDLLTPGIGKASDAIALRQGSQALLTALYCSTDRLSRCGASMKNLAHSASFHAGEKIAPSNPGIKHLNRAIDGDRRRDLQGLQRQDEVFGIEALAGAKRHASPVHRPVAGLAAAPGPHHPLPATGPGASDPG